MSDIFQIVYGGLMWLSSRTGLTYQEVNIIVYYLLVPLVFLILADRILRTHLCSTFFAIAWLFLLLLVPGFERFSSALFDWSVGFLLSFSQLGWNYTVASVLICVVFPGLVFLLLCFYAFRKRVGQPEDPSSVDYP